MASGMLGTAITGLQAFQRSLETTSHNISNVNTEGYSRQRVDLAAKKEQMIGVGYLGTGVSINNISRSYDQFITTQLRSSTA
ncbi:MAG: flagellar basal body protein, partial [Methylococcaceae bacterium]